MMKARLIIVVVFLAMLAGIGVAAAMRARETHERVTPAVIKPEVVRCEPLRERDYFVTESFHGLIEANARVELAFQIPGRISQLGEGRSHPVKTNDTVEPGQILAMLEPLRYQAAEEAAQAKMEEAKAAMAAADAQIADAQARLADAKHEYERFVDLKSKGAANPREVEKAELAVKLIQAQLDSTKAQLAAAAAAYGSSRAASTMATVNLQDATLRAPIHALVASIPVEVGQTVGPSQPVITLVDTSRMKLILGVVERKLPLIHQGQKVVVEVQALAAQAAVGNEAQLNRPREGVITIVPPAADPVTGLFKVEIDLPNDDGLLRPGMVGKATVTVAHKHAIALPAEAVGRGGDGYWACFVGQGYHTGLDLGTIGKTAVNMNTPVARKISLTPLLIDKDFILVADLPPGLDRLVVEGQSRLTDGQPVTVVSDALAVAPGAN